MRIARQDFGPVHFADIPGWSVDDVSGAVAVLKRSSADLAVAMSAVDGVGAEAAERLRGQINALADDIGEADARRFFEANFTALTYRCEQSGLLTGYYEPILTGSRLRRYADQVPLYGLPGDLVKLSDDRMRGALNGELTAARRVDGALVPYFSRLEIDAGALSGRGLELLYLDDWVEAFFLHVQGSGIVRLDDGASVRVGYAGKNGYPYTSIGELLIVRGEIAPAEMTLERLRQWLIADAARGRSLIGENASYIFFVKQGGAGHSDGPLGATGAVLEEGRSLAVDAGLIDLGLAVFVVSEGLRHHGEDGFRRLMVAQDVGSAITGPQRGDIYWGSGEEAGRLAGRTSHAGRFFVLAPNEVAEKYGWRKV